MNIDISIKRAKFIGKVNSLNQEFYFSSPTVKSRLYEVYCCSFYSSSIWDLFSRDCDKLYKSFNVAIRIGYDLPRNSHRYFIEEVINFPHPKVMLCSRFVKFYKTVTNCNKLSVRLLSNLGKDDVRTVFGRNLQNIASECNTERNFLTPALVKHEMKYFPVPPEQSWRIPLLQNLLAVRAEEMTLDNFENAELDQLIEHVCTT